MRILHTADWHVGRVWKNVVRLDESEATLAFLLDYVKRERIDLLLMAGDVFDVGSPSAEAERLVFRFFHALGRLGVPAAVVAGNHDSATRIDAWGMLAELAGVRVVGRPRAAKAGGVVEIATRSGPARVAMVPFAAGRVWAETLADAGELVGDETTFAPMLRRGAAHLARAFRGDAVNLMMGHTHVEGAVVGATERPLHLAPEWAVAPSDFPASAQYVALGHIHRPQAIAAAAAPTRFCGSPFAFDFGEADDAKSFVVVDVAPGGPARVELIPYEGAKSLGDVRGTLETLAAEQLHWRQFGWLRVTVPLTKPDPDLARKVRQMFPQAIVVRPELPESTQRPAAPTPLATTAHERYRAFVRRERGVDPGPELAAAFASLYAEVQGGGHASDSPDA